MFYLWYLLILKQFGREAAAVVRVEQAEQLDRLGGGFGQQLEDLISIIEQATQHAVGNPTTVPGRPEIQLPPEYFVALRMLTTTVDSPYYVHWPEFESTGRLPDLQGNDFTLTECLCHCRDHATHHFSTALASMTVDARALSEWINTKFAEFGTVRP